MKLAFSTLGCPMWELGQIAETARSLGYDAIELRAVGGDLDLLNRREFQQPEVSNTRKKLEDLQVSICCVDTSCNFHSTDASERSQQVELALRHAQLAASLGASLIRVFPDKVQPGSNRDETRDNIAQCLHQIGAGLPDGVRVGLETHGDFARGQIAAEVVNLANHRNVCLIWDVANSMNAGDSTHHAAIAVGPYLAHVHLRDARKIAGSEHWLPVLAGRGEVSFEQVVNELRQLGYDGFISFEWEKYWHPEIEDPEVALPDFMNAIKRTLAHGAS
jgi:sugar phosphate isomerase/epimerase